MSSILEDLTGYIHPLVLRENFRSQTQTRLLAEKLLQHQVDDSKKLDQLLVIFEVILGATIIPSIGEKPQN